MPPKNRPDSRIPSRDSVEYDILFPPRGNGTMLAEPISKQAATSETDFVPRAKYNALRETLELAVGVAVSRAQIARGEAIPHKEAMRRVRERLVR